jgi:8-hydroxy-5-deazaflavin:NADPH oxidoreductase
LHYAWATQDIALVIGTRNPLNGATVVAQLNEILGKTAIGYGDNTKAAEVAEIVALTVPYHAQQATVNEIRDSLAGKILIDATVPLVAPKVSNVQLPPGRIGSCCHSRHTGR